MTARYLKWSLVIKPPYNFNLYVSSTWMSVQCRGRTLWHTYPLLHQCWLLPQRQVGFSWFKSEDWTDSDTSKQSVIIRRANVFFRLYSKTTVSTTETVTVKSSSDTTWVLSCCDFYSGLKLFWGLFTESRSARLNNYWARLCKEKWWLFTSEVGTTVARGCTTDREVTVLRDGHCWFHWDLLLKIASCLKL